MNNKEAMTALVEGKKIRDKYWNLNVYVKLNEEGNIIDYLNNSIALRFHEGGVWEEYIEYVDFNTAMQHIANGGRAKRKNWDYAIMLGFDGVFETIVWNKYDNDDEYTVKKQDILTKDWILL